MYKHYIRKFSHFHSTYLKKNECTGASSIYNALVKNNVSDVFMYSGGAIMPLIDKFKQHGKERINYYINNHEQNCGHAATGYAKSSGKTGVVLVTSGPGLTNMVTPILDATNDSTPLVVFSGQVSVAAMGTNAFQECPAVDITSPCTKWSYCAKKGDNLFELTNEAFAVANSGKRGAVHIDLPKCILTANNGANAKFGKEISYESDVFPTDYNKLYKIIMESQRPVIYAGKGVNNYPVELAEFIEKYNIYITTTIHAMGVYNERHKYSLGFLGMHGFPVANHAVQNADLIIAIGSRFDDRTTGDIKQYAPLCKNIIHVNIEKSEFGKVVDTTHKTYVHKLHMDCGMFLRNINNVYTNHNILSNKRAEWGDKIRHWKDTCPIRFNVPANNKLNTQMVLKQIYETIDNDNTIITTGVGNHQMMACQFIRWTRPWNFITSGSLGVMGTGLPYAIGVKIANPKKVVIDIDGDGSFNHTLADLQTIFKYKLPVKIFVMNDGHMSMVRAWETLFYNKNYIATDCSHNPDYNRLASSYGIHSIKLDNQSELKDIVKYVIDYNEGPILCNAIVESDLCLPLVGPGKALDDILTLDNYDACIALSGQTPS